MIVTVGHTKGGVGKSTLALNIAIERLRAGVDTLLIDGDPKQGSIGKAIEIRAAAGLAPVVPCVLLDDASALRRRIDALKEHYRDIVIDVGGKDSNALRAALLVTDILLLPIAPESVEIWAIDDILAIVEEARAIRDVRVFAVLNRAKSYGKDNRDTQAAIRDYSEITLLNVAIGARSVYGSAFGLGRSVAEYRPLNKKAAAELAMLMAELFDRVQERTS